MNGKQSYIVTVKEGFSAQQVAEESVKKVVKSAQIYDGVATMATDFVPDEGDVFENNEMGMVVATLSDKEAEALLSKPGVQAIEPDEVVFALGDEEGIDGADDLHDNFYAEDLIDFDSEATEEIDAAFADDDLSEEDYAQLAPEDAVMASQVVPLIDEMELDDSGQIEPLDADVPEISGIPRDKILSIVKCILQCVVKQTSGKVDTLPDQKIAELLSAFGVPGNQESVQAIRDYITCGLRITYVPQAWRYSQGTGVRVAVIDTGITPRHPDLRVYGGVSYVSGVTSWFDDHYHGTHVAGTIAALRNNRGVVGCAPGVRLYAVKVLDRNGRGRTSGILNGLAWCLRHRMHIANLSLGSGATTHSTRNYSRAYEVAGQRLRRANILAVAAAGNSGATRQPFVNNPGRCPSFMAVGAIDCQRRRASFSSYGPQVEICAPGVQVMSTYPTSGYRRLSGTSMACPHVAGIAALVKRRHPTWSADRIRIHLWRTAMDLGRPGRDWLFGYGQVRAYHAVR